MEPEKNKVLIVNDNPVMRKVFSNLLIKENLTVVMASDGAEALSELKKTQIDIVLLDIYLPGQDGFEVCRKIKSNPHAKAIPVIFTNLSNDVKHILMVYESGGEDFITTPFTAEGLVDKIKFWLSQKKNKEENKLKVRNKEINVKRLTNDFNTLKSGAEKVMMKDKNLLVTWHEYYDFEQIKSNFLKIICHELRTPVGAIIGFTELLKENINSDDNFRILDTISLASRKIKELSDTALMVSQIDPEKVAESMRPTKINSMIDYAISDVYEELTNKKLKISLPKADIPAEIIIEPDLIKEVIEIFLSNAILTSPPNSTIALEIDENEDSIALTVNYPCQGIYNEEFKKINKYITGDLKIQHTNWPDLRLAIARFIMDLHNAKIKIFDHTGTEARINMIFPINNAKRNALHQLLSKLN